jgi:hypothetical protein
LANHIQQSAALPGRSSRDLGTVAALLGGDSRELQTATQIHRWIEPDPKSPTPLRLRNWPVRPGLRGFTGRHHFAHTNIASFTCTWMSGRGARPVQSPTLLNNWRWSCYDLVNKSLRDAGRPRGLRRNVPRFHRHPLAASHDRRPPIEQKVDGNSSRQRTAQSLFGDPQKQLEDNTANNTIYMIRDHVMPNGEMLIPSILRQYIAPERGG